MGQFTGGGGTTPGTYGGAGSNVVGGQTAGNVGSAMAPYNQVAPFTNQQTAGMQLVSDLSQPVQGALGNALNMNNWMGSGALMSPTSNPYLRGMYDAAAQGLMQQYQTGVAPNILQQAAQSGTLGSAGMAQGFQDAQSSLGLSLSDLANQMYGGAYNTGLSATQNAIGQTPGLATAQYIPSGQLINTGALGQGQAQNVLNTATQNLTGQANWPFQGLGTLGSALSTLGGQQSSTVAHTPSTASGK